MDVGNIYAMSAIAIGLLIGLPALGTAIGSGNQATRSPYRVELRARRR